MKKKLLLIPVIFALASCSKTNLLYKEDAYNSPIFDENYYLEREDIDSLTINKETSGLTFTLHSEGGLGGLTTEDVGGYVWGDSFVSNDEMWGYHNNLSGIERKFNYGILSKLYDGRVRCDGLYQKSRVQLNKTGYATYFPKSLVSAKYIAFACRGGSTLESNTLANKGINSLKFNFTLAFYIHLTDQKAYDKVTFKLNDMEVLTDNGGRTSLISFYLPDLYYLNGAVAMSLEWECTDTRISSFNLTDDYLDKEKDHLAIMLYEVFIGQSEWF